MTRRTEMKYTLERNDPIYATHHHFDHSFSIHTEKNNHKACITMSLEQAEQLLEMLESQLKRAKFIRNMMADFEAKQEQG